MSISRGCMQFSSGFGSELFCSVLALVRSVEHSECVHMERELVLFCSCCYLYQLACQLVPEDLAKVGHAADESFDSRTTCWSEICVSCTQFAV